MCGICGVVGEADEETTERMVEQLRHRGPDGAGARVFQKPPAALGHARLAIIDLSAAAAQPMSTEDGRFHITYNGEVYNFRRLRAELESEGHRFRSNSDTEVVLAAFARWGPRCLERFSGQFAFAVWDARDGTLFLARDRLGIKPLYYAADGKRFAFASEITPLLGTERVSSNLNWRGVVDLLFYGYTVPPATCYADIHELPPAHYAVWRNGRLETHCYWQLCPKKNHSETATAVEHFYGLLQQTVEARLVADVPVGVFLSGGADSSSVAALANADVAVTVAFPGFSYQDEIRFARRVARHLRLEHIVINVPFEPDETFLDHLLEHFGQPFGNPTAMLTWYLAKAARQHVKVILAGDGGDEALLGYPRHKGYTLLCSLQSILPRSIRRLLSHFSLPFESTRGLHTLRRINEFFSALRLPPETAYAYWNAYFTSPMLRRLLRGEPARLLEEYDPADFLADALRRFGRGAEAAAAADALSFLPFNVLQYGDRMSMAHGLEVRVPFCDHKLVEFCAGLPAKLRRRPHRAKHILRVAMRERLPHTVFTRKKVGFNPPTAELINTTLRPLFDTLPHNLPDWLDADYVRRLLAEHRAGRSDHALRLWLLLMLARWRRST